MFGITTDYEHNATHKRERISIWEGAFMSTFVGDGLSLPKGDGYMITLDTGERFKVLTPGLRTGENWQAVDEAVALAIATWYADNGYIQVLTEQAQRILQAGISHPANWDEMGSSAKDMWEERMIRSLDRQAARTS